MMMRRRDFVAGLGGAAVAWPLTARAQQPELPVVGVLVDGGPNPEPEIAAAFAGGLAETGYVEGRNVAIEWHVANDAGRLPEYAVDLVRRRVDVIVTPGSTPAALAAKAATATIPIVFGTGLDPVQTGLVVSLNRPGGNITGFTELNGEVWSKRLGLLRMLAPTATRYGALVSPQNPISDLVREEARAAEKAMGQPIEVISVSDDEDVAAAFSGSARNHIGAMMVSPGVFFFIRRAQIIRLAANYSVPTAYWLREFPKAGGLMSYGSSITEMLRQVGIYAGRILRGAKPADLPVVRATKFELVINARAAGALGLTIPETLLATADEVIQ
jgi:putative tryptophan/tyrosine transport system substrate-binding protein